MKGSRIEFLYLLILLPAIYFAIFLHLDSRPFRIWDESYLGVHTYEMMHNHNYLVTYSFGSPEMSNTKPPLVIWCMVLCSKLLGFNELSIRLPNALAGLIICLSLFFFSSRYLRSSLLGLLSVFILISTTGFIKLHVIRSGEYDAFLMLFTFLYCLFYFMILADPRGDRVRLWWMGFTLAVIGAILSKGIAGVLALPGLFVYTLVERKLKLVLSSAEIYASIFAILCIGLGYYFLREHYNHGYLQAVNDNELGGRYVNVNEGHKEEFQFYWLLISSEQFLFVMPFVLIGTVHALQAKGKQPMQKMVLFSACVSVCFLLVISMSATKLAWYDAPAVPFVALIAGYGLSILLDFLFKIGGGFSTTGQKVAALFFVALLIGPAYSNIINSNLNKAEVPWEQESFSVNNYLNMVHRKVLAKDYKTFYDPYMYRSQLCEKLKLQDKGTTLDIIHQPQLLSGDTVITQNDVMRNQIAARFSHKILDMHENIEIWQLGRVKCDTIQQ